MFDNQNCNNNIKLFYQQIEETEAILDKMSSMVINGLDNDHIKLHYTCTCAVYIGDIIRNITDTVYSLLINNNDKLDSNISNEYSLLINRISTDAIKYAKYAVNKSYAVQMADSTITTFIQFISERHTSEIKRMMLQFKPIDGSSFSILKHFGDKPLSNSGVLFEFFETSDDVYTKLYITIDMFFGMMRMFIDNSIGKQAMLLNILAKYILHDDENGKLIHLSTKSNN